MARRRLLCQAAVVFGEALEYHQIMKAEQFEETLRQFIRREPFQTFVVELVDGRVIAVDHPKLVFGGGAASFITYDLVEFACEEVQAIRPGVPGASA